MSHESHLPCVCFSQECVCVCDLLWADLYVAYVLCLSMDVWNTWRDVCLLVWEIIKPVFWRNMPSFCFRRDSLWQPPAILDLNIYKSLVDHGNHGQKFMLKYRKKWLHFILTRCLQQSTKCNSHSSKQNGWFASAPLPDPWLRWYAAERSTETIMFSHSMRWDVVV